MVSIPDLNVKPRREEILCREQYSIDLRYGLLSSWNKNGIIDIKYCTYCCFVICMTTKITIIGDYIGPKTGALFTRHNDEIYKEVLHPGEYCIDILHKKRVRAPYKINLPLRRTDLPTVIKSKKNLPRIYHYAVSYTSTFSISPRKQSIISKLTRMTTSISSIAQKLWMYNGGKITIEQCHTIIIKLDEIGKSRKLENV